MKELPMEEVYKERVAGKTLKELSIKYGLSISALSTHIDVYCRKNALLSPYDVCSNKMYLDKIGFMSYLDLAKKYNCSSTRISERVKQYIEKYNLPSVEEAQGEFLYFSLLGGKSISSIQKEYDLSRDLIKNRIELFMGKYDLSTPAEETKKDMYEARMRKESFASIAKRYDKDSLTASRMVREYAKKNHLPLIQQRKKESTIRLNFFNTEIYSAFENGYSIKNLALSYNVSYETMRTRIKKETQNRVVQVLEKVLEKKKIEVRGERKEYE